MSLVFQYLIGYEPYENIKTDNPDILAMLYEGQENISPISFVISPKILVKKDIQ